MITENNKIYDYPLDEIEDGWTFDPMMSEELFYSNSVGKYESFYEFLSDFLEESSIDGRTIFEGFFIENNKPYYEDCDGEIYTFQSVPYSLIVSSAIKYELTRYSRIEDYDPHIYVIWYFMLKYLLFTNFTVRQIFEESDIMKSDKKYILYAFFRAFISIKSSYLVELNSVFYKKDCKERLLYILVFSGIPKNKAEALTEKCCVKKDFSVIITYYEEITSS